MCAQVDTEGAVPVVNAGSLEPGAETDSNVENYGVEAVERIFCVVHHGRALTLVGRVGDDARGGAALGFDQRDSGRGGLFVDIGARDRGALPRGQDRDRTPVPDRRIGVCAGTGARPHDEHVTSRKALTPGRVAGRLGAAHRGTAPTYAATWRGFSTGVSRASISARLASSQGGRTRVSPRCSGDSSAANPGLNVASSKSTPLGSRKYTERNQKRSITGIACAPAVNTRSRQRSWSSSWDAHATWCTVPAPCRPPSAGGSSYA